MGSTLARLLLRSGYRVTVWNRTRDKADAARPGRSGPGPKRGGRGRREPHRGRLRLRLQSGERNPRHGGGRFRPRRPRADPADHRQPPGGTRQRGLGAAARRRLRRRRHPGGSEPDGEARHDDSRVGRGSRVPAERGRPRGLRRQREVPGRAGRGSVRDGPGDALVRLRRGAGLLPRRAHRRIGGLPRGSLRIARRRDLARPSASSSGTRARSSSRATTRSPRAPCGSRSKPPRRLAQAARESGINAEFPTFAAALFKRAMAAGHGDEEVAALIKVLRASAA